MRNVFLILTAIILLGCKKKSIPEEVTPVDTVAVKTTTPVTTTPTDPTTPVTTPTTPRTTISYLALGDSYTIGQDVEQKDCFPYQLSAALSKYSLRLPIIVARTGWTTDDLIQAIDAGGYAGQTYDVVTLLIGVNDQYQGRTQDNYRIKFVQLLNTAIKFANNNKKKVFVVSIPDYGVTPYANGQEATIGPQIDAFNAINKAESDKAGVNYIDITPTSKKAATDQSLTAADGLHPSASQYALWVKLIAPVVEAQVK